MPTMQEVSRPKGLSNSDAPVLATPPNAEHRRTEWTPAVVEVEVRGIYANEAALNPPADSVWGKLLALVPEGARVLDVGCGNGNFASAMTSLRRCLVTGVELDEGRARLAERQCHRLLTGDIAVLLQERRIEGPFDI